MRGSRGRLFGWFVFRVALTIAIGLVYFAGTGSADREGYRRASAYYDAQITFAQEELARANDLLGKNGMLMPSNLIARDIPDADAYDLALTIIAIEDLPDREDELDAEGHHLRYFKTTVLTKDGRQATFVNKVPASGWELMAIDFMHGRFRRAREAEERARVAGN